MENLNPVDQNYRPAYSKRTFHSEAVDDYINKTAVKMKDQELALLFVDCLPNTLDTTINYTAKDKNGNPDTFIITGDIPAISYFFNSNVAKRKANLFASKINSTNQALPYLQFAKYDSNLQNMLKGLIYRQVTNVLIDPWANAFNYGPSNDGHHTDRVKPDMPKQVFESKYEIDSLMNVIKFGYHYWKNTGDTSAFDQNWKKSMELIVATVKYEQLGTEQQNYDPNYLFQRLTWRSTDTLMMDGNGPPAKHCGMSKSFFRPSDDGQTLPFFVPGNAMAVVELKHLSEIYKELNMESLSSSTLSLANQIDVAIKNYAIQNFGGTNTFVYEVDGFGSQYFMDDANIPGLLSLPYLGYISKTDPLYLDTRKRLLSTETNPFYFKGTVGEGIGGAHNGIGWIWPMSLIIEAFTETDDQKIIQLLEVIKKTALVGSKEKNGEGFGFMHESFWLNNASDFTRPWFAWCNSLFGELIVKKSSK